MTFIYPSFKKYTMYLQYYKMLSSDYSNKKSK